MIGNVMLLFGGLGLVLFAGAVFGLVPEILRRKPNRWQLMTMSALGYLLSLFVAPPPAAWLALTHGADLGTSLRSGSSGVFLALMCLAYINACRKAQEECEEKTKLEKELAALKDGRK